MDALLQTNQEAADALESRTLQLSLAPEAPSPLFSLPPPLAHALMLQPSKHYTIGNIMTAFHTYILNHSLVQSGGLLKVNTLFALERNAPSISYSAALVLLCRQLRIK